MRIKVVTLILASLISSLSVHAASDPPVLKKVTSSDSVGGDFFGDFVAVDGSTLVVGASLTDGSNSDAGAAYVFIRDTTGWVQQQKLTIPDDSMGFLFGTAVGISGETVVVGVPFDYPTVGPAGGAGYVFTRSGTQWSAQQRLTGPTPFDGDNFGYAVAISGDTIVVGASADVKNGTNSGAAYVFVRQGTTWSLQQTLVPSDAFPDENFGTSVAVLGDTAAVGAIGDGTSHGAGFVFTRSGTTWSEAQKLSASDGNEDDGYGLSVGLGASTLIFGAPRINGQDYQRGAAYVYAKAGSIFSGEQKLTDEIGNSGDQFGHSVAVSGGRLVVGSVAGDTDPAIPDTGSADLYVLTNGVWTFDQRLVAGDLQTHDVFGHSVAMNSSKIAVGAVEFFNNGPGAVYVFETQDVVEPPPPPKDTNAPVITAISTNPKVLAPPNHEMWPVTVSVTATDDVAVVSCKIVCVKSSDSDDGTGDGSTVGDVQITGDLTLNLRAERASAGDRIYTITVECKDAAGNASRADTYVTVPKSSKTEIGGSASAKTVSKPRGR